MESDADNKKAQLVSHRKEQILSAAKHIFAKNGYRCTKIDQIADYLNIGKGTLYRYFTDKKALFMAVFEHGMKKLQQTMVTQIYPMDDPCEKILAGVRTYFAFFDNDSELIEIMMQVRSEFKDEYRCVYLDMYSDYIVRIQQTLIAGVKTGVFRTIDVEKTADAISAILQGVMQSFYIREFGPQTCGDGSKSTVESRETKPALLADNADAVATLLLDGLLKRQ